MPFHSITLNDGRKIPQIGFGTWKIPQEVTAAQVDQAVEVGFDHIDTAQGALIGNIPPAYVRSLIIVYRNEEQVGQAIKEGGLARKDLWITTKWSGVDDKDAQVSINESLEKLGVDYVDLYLIHHPRVTKGDIKGAWEAMEDIQKQGKAKSIGVSKWVDLLRPELFLIPSFSVDDLKELLKHAKVKPVVNQILLHPYVIGTQQPLLDYLHKEHIVPEGYSTLIPITSKPGGPVDKPVDKLAKKYKVEPEQILLAWSKAKQ